MENSQKKLMPFKEVMAYSLGLFGMQAVIFYLNSYQAEFYNLTMGADLAIIGIILLLGKVVSAVFDPFVGSGTTAVMSIANGRNFLGFDLSNEYCELAKSRVNDHIISNNLQGSYEQIA